MIITISSLAARWLAWAAQTVVFGLACGGLFGWLLGNAWSEHAENHFDLSNIAQVLALSPNRHQNALAVYHFSHIFGSENVFSIRSGSALKGRTSNESARFRRHEKFFPEDVTWSSLSSQLAKGATIKATRLNENFGWLDYLEKNRGVVPLFSRLEEGKTTAINGPTAPTLPCTLIALVQNENSSTSRR